MRAYVENAGALGFFAEGIEVENDKVRTVIKSEARARLEADQLTIRLTGVTAADIARLTNIFQNYLNSDVRYEFI